MDTWGRMIANGQLTDGQRNYLRGLPLYSWAVWGRRVSLGAFAFMFAVAVAGGDASLMALPFLLLLPLVLINSMVARLVSKQMARILGVQGFVEQARLGTAINRVIFSDAFLGGRA
jgi:hypothetical protein